MNKEYYEKYLKYKNKYNNLKKIYQIGGVNNQNIKRQIGYFRTSPLYNIISLDKNTITITRINDDSIIHIIFPDNFPSDGPLVTINDIPIDMDKWSISTRLSDFLQNIKSPQLYTAASVAAPAAAATAAPATAAPATATTTSSVSRSPSLSAASATASLSRSPSLPRSKLPFSKNILIIGGGDPSIYSNYFQVGNHPGADFGIDRDWRKVQFWMDLITVLNGKKFNAIYFDRGSESWLHNIEDIAFKYMCSLLLYILKNNGVIIIDSDTRLKQQIHERLFDIINISSFRIGKGISDVYNIFSVVQLKDTLLNKTNLDNIYEGSERLLGYKMPNGYMKWERNEVIENNIFDFIRNRLL